MSNTTFLHGVDARLVLDTLPTNTTTVTATSKGLNLSQVDSFIARAAGIVNAQLVRHGISPDSLDPNTSQLAQDAIISYASAYCLERIGGSVDQIERRYREWNDIFTLLKNEPQSLGSAQDNAATLLVKSNIDTSNPSTRKWTTSTFRY